MVPLTSPFRSVVDDEKLPRFLMYEPEYLGPIRDQGDCGSCYAMVASDLVAGGLTIATSGRFRSNLSAELLSR